MGKQRTPKGYEPDHSEDLAAAAADGTNAPHVPPLPPRIADQVCDREHGEPREGSTDSSSEENANRPSVTSAADVAEEHRQSIANILRSLTGSTDRAADGDELSAKLQRELMGQVINNYEIVHVVSSGGMGDVFGAVHTVMGRKAAIKVLRPEHCGDPALVQRFFNEARAANSIRHPNIVEVLDVGILPAGLPYITMELLEGETLAERLRRLGTMDIDLAVNFVVQAASGLQAAHRAGIVHRDLKPDNLFIVPDPREPGRELMKILDFGIAKLHGDKLSKVKTNVGSILGTPPYMSPEQCRGIPEGVDHRSDVYALGVILFEMLCGAPPFVADGIGDVMVMHLSSPPPLPTWRRKEIPARIEQTILWALEKNPDQRIPSMADFVFALGAGPTPVPYLATPTGLTAPSFGPPPLNRASVPPLNRASAPPPAAEWGPTDEDEPAPETVPPSELLITQYSAGHPSTAPARASVVPPPNEEVGGRRRWLTSFVWASAAGLLIAAGGWFFTNGPNAEDAHAEERSPKGGPSLDANYAARAGRAQANERPVEGAATPVEYDPERAPTTPTPLPATAEDGRSAPANTDASPGESAGPNSAAVGSGVVPSSAPRDPAPPAVMPAGNRAVPKPPPNRWAPTKSVAEVREALAAQAASSLPPDVAQPEPAASDTEQPGPARVESPPPGPAPEGPALEQPAPSAPKAVTLGTLNLAATPWATVSLNGRVLGVTPLLNLRLPVGVHQLNLSNPELGKSTTVVVEISADKPTSRFVEWHKPK